MGRNIETKFYTVNQNNSGGFYIKNENVAEYVIIEAIDVCHAQSRAEKILENYRSYCPCCGPRWNDSWLSEEDGKETPMIYSEPIKDYLSWVKNAVAIIHYIDGTKEIINLKYKYGE